MQILIQLKPEQLQHMTNDQVGAFVAHCFKLKGFAGIEIVRAGGSQPYIKIALEMPFAPIQLIDSPKLQAQLEKELLAFADLEPFPCPCGCGAFISVSPCHRQSGQLVDTALNEEERAFADRGDIIGAIKAYRTRVGGRNPDGTYYPGLKECKDIVDAYRARKKS